MEAGLLGFPPGRGGLFRRAVLLSTQQWIVPKGCKDAKVTVVGSGAGNSGGAGGPGGVAVKDSLRLTPGEVVSVTVGAAIASGGGAGNASSFGRYLSATGGQAGTNPVCGVGTGGDRNSTASWPMINRTPRTSVTSYSSFSLLSLDWMNLWNNTTTPPDIPPGEGVTSSVASGQGIVIVEWFEDFTS